MEKILQILCLFVLTVDTALATVAGDICLVCYFTYFVLPFIICIGLISLPVLCVCVYCRFFHKKNYWMEPERTVTSVQAEKALPEYDGTVKTDCNV